MAQDRIVGKQVEDNTLTKDKLSLVAPTESKDPVTKGFFDSRKINNKPLSSDVTLTTNDLTNNSGFVTESDLSLITSFNNTVGF